MAYVSETADRLRRISSMVDIQFEKTLKEAADLISELSLKLHNSQMERSSMYYNGGWVPVCDRLPQYDGTYLCTCTNIPEVIALNFTFYNNSWMDEFDSKYHPTAWMPMPRKYKEIRYD